MFAIKNQVYNTDNKYIKAGLHFFDLKTKKLAVVSKEFDIAKTFISIYYT